MKSAHTEKAYQFIREKILGGAYGPGRRLQTVELAEEIGVSRTPVRDALRRLELEGMVDVRARLGASVRQLDAAQYKELCELRLAMESAAAELAARNSSYTDLVEIQAAFEEMERLVNAIATTPDALPLHRQLVQQDIRFHYGILKAARNELIRNEIIRLHVVERITNASVRKETGAEASKTITVEKRRWILECHRKILAAIRDRQPEAARQAMHEHIEDIIICSLRRLEAADDRLDWKAIPPEELRHAPY